MTFDYPTVAAMAGFLAVRLSPSAALVIPAGPSIDMVTPATQHGWTQTTEMIGISSAMAISGTGQDGERLVL